MKNNRSSLMHHPACLNSWSNKNVPSSSACTERDVTIQDIQKLSHSKASWATRNWAQQKKWEQWPRGGMELAPGQFCACRSYPARREGKPWTSWGAHSNHEKVLWQGQKDQEIVWQSPDEVCVECRYPDCQTKPGVALYVLSLMECISAPFSAS